MKRAGVITQWSRPGFNYQHPFDNLPLKSQRIKQPLLVSRILCMHMVHRHTYQLNTNTQKIKQTNFLAIIKSKKGYECNLASRVFA